MRDARQPSLTISEFIDFLFSKSNSIFNPEHSKVFQNMDRPLCHYWIDSSHNTQVQHTIYIHTYTLVHAVFIWCPCIHTLYMQSLYIPFIQSLYIPYIQFLYIPYIQFLYIPYIQFLYIPYIQSLYIPYIQSLYIPYIQFLYIPYIQFLYIPYIQSLYIPYIQSLYIPYIQFLYIPYIQFLYIPYIQFLYIPYIQSLYTYIYLIYSPYTVNPINMESLLFSNCNDISRIVAFKYSNQALLVFIDSSFVARKSSKLANLCAKFRMV